MAGTPRGDRPHQFPHLKTEPVLEFFETSGRNLLAAEGRKPASGTMSRIHRRRRPDARQWLFPRQGRPRETDRDVRIPYTIIRSTQFLEFLRAIADSSADGNMVRLSPGLFQPIAADGRCCHRRDVHWGRRETASSRLPGPQRAPFNEIVARYLKAVGDRVRS